MPDACGERQYPDVVRDGFDLSELCVALRALPSIVGIKLSGVSVEGVRSLLANPAALGPLCPLITGHEQLKLALEMRAGKAPIGWCCYLWEAAAARAVVDAASHAGDAARAPSFEALASLRMAVLDARAPAGRGNYQMSADKVTSRGDTLRPGPGSTPPTPPLPPPPARK